MHLLRRSFPQWMRKSVPSACFQRCYGSSSSSSISVAPVQHVELIHLAHQSRLHLRIPDATPTTIQVFPILNESEFTFKVFTPEKLGKNHEYFAFHREFDDDGVQIRTMRIVKNDSPSIDKMTLQLFVPHLIDLHVSAICGNVHIRDKIEGNVQVALGSGDIRVNKIRGTTIDLKTNKGQMEVATLVEGENVKLVSNQITCKRLMAGRTDIKINHQSDIAQSNRAASQFGAIYSSLSLIQCTAKQHKLHIGNVHGSLRLSSEDMQSLHIDSVNGALHVEDTGLHCNVSAHFDAWQQDAANSISVGGNVCVSVEPSSAALDVELHGRSIHTPGCVFASSEVDQLDDDYAIFTGEMKAQPTASTSHMASGKINVGSAKSAALRTSFFANDKSTNQDDTDEKKAPLLHPRLLVHTSNGIVKLEQLDWMTKMKRKHLKSSSSTR